MEITETLFAAKKNKGLSFADLGDAIGRDEVWVAALFHGQASASEEEAGKLASLLGLETGAAEGLAGFSTKGLGPGGPTDPLIYRLSDIMQVYGMQLKSLIHEKFGDGIMSAIAVTLHVDKEEDPKCDRVRLTMSGKFLPYKKW